MIVSITTTVPARTPPGFVWFPLLIPDADTIAAIYERLKEDAVIYGQRIEADLRPNGTRQITARSEIVLGAGIIGTITELHFKLVDEHGKAL